MNLDGIILGLGNPGKKYLNTRHNLGYMVVDAFLQRLERDSDWDVKNCSGLSQGSAWFCRWHQSGQTFMLLKPGTYMNRSGIALAEAKRKHFFSPEQLLVVHDELDLEPGRIKMKKGGGFAGHNGLRSVAEQMGFRDFLRLRMGIGRPAPGRETASYVLQKFIPREKELLQEAMALAVEGLFMFCRQGFLEAQKEINSRTT